jgi:peptidoglycan/xylan/chitin deacetylase (PgdA/CDA1 family)
LGFKGVHWEDVYDHMSGKRSLNGRSVMLTFDDGYLDNWVFAYPILKKYGMKGTIFNTTDFIDPGREKRLNLDDVWNKRARMEDLLPVGFLNWTELKEMLDSGLIDIQSHGKTHTWYFSGPEVVDFHFPSEKQRYPWLFWNERPERKPYYMTEDQCNFLPWGYPVLEHGKSLDVRRFFPEPEALESLFDFIDFKKSKGFFKDGAVRGQLQEFFRSTYDGCLLPGHLETDTEFTARRTEELVASKKILEHHLKKKIDYICWPGGGYDKEVLRLAEKAGYRAWTLSSRDNLNKRNRTGDDPSFLKRIGTSNTISINGCGNASGGSFYQMLKILSHQDSKFYSILLKIYKVAAIALRLKSC